MRRSFLEPGKPVVVAGKDFFHRKAEVRLENSGLPGWFVRLQGTDVPINPKTMKYELRRVSLVDGKRSIQVIEHLLALRLLLGLDQVRIVPSSRWVPYGDSSARIFFDPCKSGMRTVGGLRHYSVAGAVTVVGDAEKSWITYAPHKADKLVVRVHIDYPSLGICDRTFEFPGTKLEDIAYARTQGWPRHLWYATWLWPGFWDHRRNAVWPHQGTSDEILDSYARHRALDILGALGGLCPPQGTLVGKVESYCAGHALDMKLIQLAYPLLAEVKEGKKLATK